MPWVSMWAVAAAAVENCMQIHKAVGHKDVQSKDLAVRTAGAVHKEMVVHKELVGHIGHILLGADHHYTSDLGVWGCPIDL